MKEPVYFDVIFGLNDLTSNTNTINIKGGLYRGRINRIKTIYQVGVSGIAYRKNVKKILIINKRLSKFCLSKSGLFLNNNDIDDSCVNRGNTLTKKVEQY